MIDQWNCENAKVIQKRFFYFQFLLLGQTSTKRKLHGKDDLVLMACEIVKCAAQRSLFVLYLRYWQNFFPQPYFF